MDAAKSWEKKIIRKNIEQHIILRTSWVFSRDGNNFVNKMISKADKKMKLTLSKINWAVRQALMA